MSGVDGETAGDGRVPAVSDGKAGGDRYTFDDVAVDPTHYQPLAARRS